MKSHFIGINTNLSIFSITKYLKLRFSPKHRALTISFILITLLFFALRLYRFEDFMGFHIDQAQQIAESKEMIDNQKIRLIGPLIGSRVVDGIGFFIGPHYYYILTIFGLLLNWNAVLITKALLLMWLASALLLYYWIGKKLDWWVATCAYLFMAWHPLLIGFSRMFLNPNFLILFSIGFFYFLYKLYQKPTPIRWLLVGFFTGFCVSFHFVCLTYFGFIGLVWLYHLLVKRKLYFSAPFLVFVGALIGDLPYVVFELRHDFYNIRTIMRLGLSAGQGWRNLIAGYSIFAFWPLAIWLFSAVIYLFKKRLGIPAAFIVTLIFIGYFHYTTPHPKVRGIGMPVGWSVPLQQQLANQICQDQQANPSKFEIAAMVTADLRAMDLRWWVEQCAQPEGFDQYPFVDTLYLVDQGFLVNGELPGNWEVSSLEPYTIDSQEQVTDNLWFYKLSRIKSSD